MSSLLEKILDATETRTLCKDKATTVRKLDKILKDNKDALHVITDFDSTLTKYYCPNGKDRTIGTWGILTASSDVISPAYKKAEMDMYHYYCPSLSVYRKKQQ